MAPGQFDARAILEPDSLFTLEDWLPSYQLGEDTTYRPNIDYEEN